MTTQPSTWHRFFTVSAFTGFALLLNPSAAHSAAEVGEISLKASNGKYVYATNGGGSRVMADGAAVGSFELMTLVNMNDSTTLASGDKVAFKTAIGGHYLHASCGGGTSRDSKDCGLINASPTAAQAHETFTIEKVGGGIITNGDKVALRASNGRYCAAMESDGGSINCSSANSAESEAFTLEILSGDVGTKATFTRKFRDDFSGTWVNENIWNLDSYFTYEGSYVTRKNVTVANGSLNLHYKSGSPRTTAWASLSRGTVGKIKYGRVVARMRMDKAAGVSGAALLWPTGTYEGSELDFYEQWDKSGNRNPMYAVTHFPNHKGQQAHQAPSWAGGDAWHTWTVEWTPTYISYKVDGVQYARVTETWKIPKIEMRPGFMTAVHTGHYPTISTAKMLIDWVEVYSYTP